MFTFNHGIKYVVSSVSLLSHGLIGAWSSLSIAADSSSPLASPGTAGAQPSEVSLRS